MKANEFVLENFDDGKKPGRKGLAKRMGVDCKQSVSKLRKISANSSGERQRMAHWCANMKSGKQKTNEVETSVGRKYQELYTQYYKRAHLAARKQGLQGAAADQYARRELDRYKDRVRTGAWDPITRSSGTDRVEYRLHEDSLEEDWRNWVTGLGAASMLAGGGSAAYDAYQASQQPQQPQAQTKQVRAPQAKVSAPVAKSSAELAQQAQKTLSDPDAQLLTKVATAAGIKGTELAQFLAQTAHESANFTTTKEFGDKNYFKKYDIKHNPSKAKVLGNVKPGDGERYKGRGYIQLTGRENYRNAGKALGLPLEQRPELAERPEIAAKIAVWFWQNRVKPQVSNFNDTAQATKPINPAMKGLQDRQDKFAGMKVAMAKPATLAKTAAQAPVAKAAKPAAKPVKVVAKPTKVKRG
jgi:predicted chitinase